MNPKKDNDVMRQMKLLYGNRAVPHLPVGFDYSLTIKKLKQHYSEKFLCSYLGYADRAGLNKIEKGGIPNHLIGEALFVLFKDTFETKPPMYDLQANGFTATEQKEHSAYLSMQRKQLK